MSNFSSETSWNNLNAATIANFGKEVHDNWYIGSELLTMMMDKSVQKIGGTKISESVTVGPQGASGVFDGGVQALSIQEKEFLKRAETDWRYYYVTLTVTLREQVQNSGKPQIVKLLSQKYKNAKKTMKTNLSRGFYSDGTDFVYPDARTTGIDGIKVAFDDGTNYQYYAGLNRSASYGSNWQGNYFTLSSTVPEYSDVTSWISACERYGDAKPDAIFTTFAIADYLRAYAQPQQRFESDKLAALGFKAKYTHVDGVPIIPDHFCPSGYATGVNFDSIIFYVSPEGDMHSEGLQRPIGQKVWVDDICHVCNMICVEPRANFITKSIATS